MHWGTPTSPPGWFPRSSREWGLSPWGLPPCRASGDHVRAWTAVLRHPSPSLPGWCQRRPAGESELSLITALTRPSSLRRQARPCGELELTLSPSSKERRSPSHQMSTEAEWRTWTFTSIWQWRGRTSPFPCQSSVREHWIKQKV